MRNRSLFLAVVLMGAFLIPAAARANPAQDAAVGALEGIPGIRSSIVSAAPNLVIGSSTSNGFTMHASVDIYGDTKIGWTIQPNTVAAIDNWMHANPTTVAAGAGGMAMAGAYICGVLLTGLGAIACGTIFAVWIGYMVDTIHNAHTYGVCVTVKVYIPLFQVLDPSHLLWDGYPYVDAGSWCNRTVYITPPAPPNPQGPRTPGGCAMDPTNPACNV